MELKEQTLFLSVTSEYTPCPVFENDKIVQQPADLLTLTATYMNAATSFIKTKAGDWTVQITTYTHDIQKSTHC